MASPSKQWEKYDTNKATIGSVGTKTKTIEPCSEQDERGVGRGLCTLVSGAQEQDTAGEQLRAAREYAARIHAAMAEVQASTAREVQLAHRDAQAKSRALAESSTKVDALTSALEAAEARQAELVEQLEDAGTQLAASTQKTKVRSE